MSNHQPSDQPQILGSFALVTGLLGIFLYFTGWLYRWAYFGFFQIEVTSLKLSLESFFFRSYASLFRKLWGIF